MNFKSLRDTLRETFLTKTAEEWEALLDRAQIPAARVRRLDEILAEDHIRARGLYSVFQVDGFNRPVHVPGLSFKGNGVAEGPDGPPAALVGADTETVLRELGLQEAELRDLRIEGVI